MNTKGLIAFAAIAALLIPSMTIYGLITGSKWLSTLVMGVVPLGNIAVSASLVTISLYNLFCLTMGKINRVVALAILILSISWYPIGVIWSGNLRLTFVNSGDLWLPFSYFVATACLFTVLFNLLLRVYGALK